MIRELGYPDPVTFAPTHELASDWLDSFAESTGIPPERMILGGFSQGAVMTYALGLGASLTRPAGLIALSGFMPKVEGLELDLESEPKPPVAIGHGIYDPVIGVEWGRRARQELEAARFPVTYREYPLPHAIDPGFLAELRDWITATIPAGAAR